MAGNKTGGAKLRATMIKKFGSEEAWMDYIKERGRKGGSAKVSKGFGKNPDLAREAGRRGGLVKSSNRREV